MWRKEGYSRKEGLNLEPWEKNSVWTHAWFTKFNGKFGPKLEISGLHSIGILIGKDNHP
ncbi:hypothetical protein U1Q18_035136, partial [Sarracenia purpurea var. burkii]